MLIKITKGNYGYNNGRIVRAKTPSDKPFEVDDAEAARLIEELKIAKAVDKLPVDGKLSAEEKTPDTDPNDSADGDAVGDDDVDEENDAPIYSEEMSNAELQAIAKDYGISVPNRANKSELIAALDNFFGSAPTLRS